MKKWIIKQEKANIGLMTETMGISGVLAQILVNRNVRTKNTAMLFLKPKLEFLRNSAQMKDLEVAVQLIVSCVDVCGKIAIYGDYDVDGVTSTVILFKTLVKYGADVCYYIPHRETEGYGLNAGVVKSLKEADIDLLITCDNGISANDEVLEAKNLGMKVIIIDHHEPGYVIGEDGKTIDVVPKADAVVDPKQQACAYPFKALCAGGLAYKFSKAFYEKVNMAFDEENEFLVFAMIATICDIVDLQDENRIIVKNGLEILNRNKKINKGLWALIKEKGYEDKEINPYTVGFILGPCINAAGRLDRAMVAVELFTEEDDVYVNNLAKRLCELNEERKELTDKSVENAINNIEMSSLKDHKVIVVYDENIHESIAGIVAGRVKEHFYRPAIVLTKGEDFVKGSARSIEGYNIFEALYKNRELFVRFGGHAMAAGLSFAYENIDELRNRLNAQCLLEGEDFMEKIYIDEELDIGQVSYELASELDILSPTGKGNKEPTFMTKAVKVESIKVIEDKNTMIFTFLVPSSYRRIKGICFGQVVSFKAALRENFEEKYVERILRGVLANVNLVINIVYAIEINEYNNNVSVQMKIKDFDICKD